MEEAEKSADITRAATEWVALQDRRELTPGESARLKHWLAADVRHEGAYVRAKAAWLALDRARALAGSQEALAPSAPPVLTRRRLIAGGGLLAASAAGLLVWSEWHSRRYETALGEILHVPLRDGSTVAINTATRMKVDMAESERYVRLDQGEAWFDVQFDPTRPFIVAAGPVRVRAVGTAFSVRRREADVEILVTEGIVETWSVEAPGRPPVRLEAGSQAVVAAESVPEPIPVPSDEIDRRLAWRECMIVLDGQTLEEAAAEFNRYNARQIHVAPELAGERLVGYFRAHDTDSFVAAVERTLRAKAEAGEGGILLRRAAKRASAK